MATRAAVTRWWCLKPHKLLYNVQNSENMGLVRLVQDSQLEQSRGLNFSVRHLRKHLGSGNGI